MAINVQQQTGTTGQQQPQPVNSMAAGLTGLGAASAAPGAIKSFSFSNLRDMMKVPFNRSVGTAAVTAVRTMLEKTFGDNFTSRDMSVYLTQLDLTDTDRLAVSCIAVTLRTLNASGEPVGPGAVKILVVEGSIEPLQPRMETLPGGRTVERILVTGDVHDSIYSSYVLEHVKMTFSDLPQLHYADGVVIPRTFNTEDKAAAHALANQIVTDCAAALIEATNSVEINLAGAAGDSTLNISYNFTSKQVIDAVGHPHRADFHLELRSQQQQNQSRQAQQSLNGVNRSTLLSAASGFIDLIYSPVNNATANPWIPAQINANDPNAYKTYTPRIVITDFNTPDLITIGGKLLALVSVMAMVENKRWYQYFMQRGIAGESAGMRDLGAIGLDVNFMGRGLQRIDTTSANVTDGELAILLQTTMRDNVVISIDVPECGVSSGALGVFAAAAAGNQNANAAIIRAAQTLTNNKVNINSSMQVATDEGNRIHMGYYIDRETGNKVDIRSIDYLAVLNLLGGTDDKKVTDFVNTYTQSDYPINMRLHERYQIMRGLFPNLVITGYSTRVTLNPELLTSVMLGIVNMGINPFVFDQFQSSNATGRIVPSVSTNFALQASTGALFRQGNQGPNYGPQNVRAAHGRWS